MHYCQFLCHSFMFTLKSSTGILFRTCIMFFCTFSKLSKCDLSSLILTEVIEKSLAVTDWGCTVIGEALWHCILSGTESLWRLCWNQLGTNSLQLKSFYGNLVHNPSCKLQLFYNHSYSHPMTRVEKCFILVTMSEVWKLGGCPVCCSSSISSLLIWRLCAT